MSWFKQTFTSTIGRKVLIALTGLFLCTFLVVHLIGNLQLFKSDNGYAFNTYAVFMTSFPLIKVISYVNYFLILVHIILGIYITAQNKKARPVGFAVTKNQSSVFSRNMAIFGVIIFVFIAVHLSNFWYRYHFDKLPFVQYTEQLATGKITAVEMPDTYSQEVKQMVTYNEEAGTKTTTVTDLQKVVQIAFGSSILLVLFYVIAMLVLAFHLAHGFQSAFQSLGIRHTVYRPIIEGVGTWIFAILIPISYAAMPLYFYFFK